MESLGGTRMFFLFNLTKLQLSLSKSLLTQEFLKNGISGIDGISQVFSGIKENTASNCNEQRACAAIHQLHLCLLSDVEVAVCQ